MESTEPITIRLDQFLKLVGAVGSGGQAKVLIQGGDVQVNGQVETRRGRKLKRADIVQLEGASFQVG
jgi:ribosome-associated protein